MRRRLVELVVLLALVGGITVVAKYRSESETRPAPVATPAIPVIAGTVDSHEVPIFVHGVGTVIAYNNVVVRSQITGQLVSINFTQGRTVHKGDLLAEIDPRPFQAQLDQAIANRDRDQAQLDIAQKNLNRYTPLEGKGFATPQLVETQQAQVAQLQAMIKSDEAVIEAAKVNLGYTKLTSPIDGVTGIRQIDSGNVIHPTDPNGLVDITQIQPISVIFTLPEAYFVQIQQQQMAKGPLTVYADSQDGKTVLDEGKLVLIDNQIIQTTGTIRLRADFPNDKRLLWPGELINARLLVETRQNALTVPSAAVQQGPNGSYVYVVGNDNAVSIRPITADVAQITENQTLIDSGLEANEKIVVAGQYRLQPGARVQAVTGKAAAEVPQQSSIEQEVP
jgi:membrane fusion protein, multidrug efflux system